MQTATFQFNFSDLNLNISQIEQVMGYKEGESQETISELIRKLLKEMEPVCSIKAEYRVFPVEKVDDSGKSIRINDLVFDVKKIVFGQIKKSDKIAVFLCTAGPEIGIRSRTAMKDGDLLTGYVYDVIGSELVEAAGDLMQDSLQKSMASEGKKITNRYSPGYCGWDVAEQHKLFNLMNDNFCGIRLSESALMDPMKSISGFIGIGENLKQLPYTCDFCDLKDCIYRKKRITNKT
jgi:cobalamin-dependent methionine synthase I